MPRTDGTPLRVLIVEDSEDDAILLLRHIQLGGYRPEMQRVDDAAAMRRALREHDWDLIITDHNIPGFGSAEALEIARRHDADIPFILVSGSIGEEIAVDAMKSGAHDYVMKDNLMRLLPAIERELREAENRRAHQEAEATIRHMAFHDGLTGLVNRTEFERRIDAAVDSARRDGEQHALFYLDLDQFKLVNDSCGHLAGDELLRQLSRRLQAGIRESDTLARLGGDEFGVLLNNCPLERAERIARALLERIKDFLFFWRERGFGVSASIGVVRVNGDDDTNALLSLSDMACYRAKEKGRGRIHVYAQGDSELSQRRGEMQWIERLQRAMENDALELHRQPIRALSGAASHNELLLRLRDDEALILPDCFIPAAERYNLMPEIDRWVLRHACARYRQQLRAKRAAGECGAIFINLSATSLSDDGLVAHIRETLRMHDIAPRCVGFEITETAAIADLDCAIRVITALRDLGCKVALDDFGTGMSSFSYLKSLKVDFIKIDGGFVRTMLEDAMDNAIVEAVNHIAHIAGIQTIAECVENDVILRKLAGLKVDFVQGWAVGRPRAFTQEAQPT